MAFCEGDDEIVISGISGTFPESENVRVLEQNLLAKKDLVTDDDRRWKTYDDETPRKMGKLKEINKFDSFFFGINEKQATAMDPQGRILLEKTYEAIVDAGYNPKELNGSRTGVFIGIAQTDSNKVFNCRDLVDVHTIPGFSKAMLANRVSYWLDAHGISYAIDTACSSSAYAFDNAYRAIRSGHCTAAIVGGCNTCMSKNESLAFNKLGLLSSQGMCKCFDESGDGFVRSEAVVVMLLQKKKHARRMYARVVHVKANCDGYKAEGVHVPSSALQQKLMEEVYEECGINPNELQYLEAHATGTKAGDPAELKAVEQVFLKNRQLPLKIGSVKSNMGHTESSSALCSITKIILNFESGILLPNLHFDVPRSDVEALRNGKLEVVSEPTEWNPGLAASNNFGFGGANCHIVLEPNPKIGPSNDGSNDCGVPPLVCVSGRTEEAVDTLLKDVEEKQTNAEYRALYHEIHKYDIPGHIYRGYAILTEQEQECIRSIQNFSGEQRPVWLVFAGVGSQWATMGRSLMKLSVCEQAFRKCHLTLTSKNIDLLHILTNEDKTIFDNILNTFIGIVATQIALVDLLKSIGIVPDGYVGHSVGELACAYTDGCLTAEQTILLAYYRGTAILESKCIHGSMAAIGLKYAEAKSTVPSDIDVACHNGPKNVTISGPTEAVEAFVERLQKSNVFARQVNSSNIPLHSRYMKEAGERLLQFAKKIIIEPKLRSAKWISSSFLENEWDLKSSKYASAEYFMRNMLGYVYFEEASSRIPQNAIIIEVAPHGLLQAILKQSTSNSNINIPLTSRNKPDNLLHLLDALGKIFENGVNLQLSKLYAPVEFPVSRGTPMISPLVKWNHNQDWLVFNNDDIDGIKYGQRTVIISLDTKKYAYLAGHKICNTIIYPASGYLVLVWETLSWMMGKPMQSTSVSFRDVRFLQATKMPSEGSVRFFIQITKNTGDFEIFNQHDLIVCGRIHLIEGSATKATHFPQLTENTLDDIDPASLYSGEDLYKFGRLQGYQYKGVFCGINRINYAGTIAAMSWQDNFIGFLDSLFQMYTVSDVNHLFFINVPTSIERLIINSEKHFSMLNSGKSELLACCDKDLKQLQCGGIEIENLATLEIWSTQPRENLILESIQFVPYMNSKLDDIRHAVTISLQIILENLKIKELKIVELVDNHTNKNDPLLSHLFSEFVDRTPFIQAKFNVVQNEEHPSITEESLQQIEKINELPKDGNHSLLIVSYIFERKEILHSCVASLQEGGFLLTRESVSEKTYPLNSDMDIIFQCYTGKEEILLFRKVTKSSADESRERLPIKVTSDSYSWITEVQTNLPLLESNKNLEMILFAQNDPFNGISGFFKCIDKELAEEKCRCFIVMDENLPQFSTLQPFYKSQLDKNLRMNVYKNGTWGTYRRLPLHNITVSSSNAYLNPLTYGDLSTLKWVNSSANTKSSLENANITVHVYYAALNFRDVMIATKRIPPAIFSKGEMQQDCMIGTEFSGRTEDGRRYMGMARAKAIANTVETEIDNMWPVPEHWSLEEAATVPVVYSTVLYALFIRGGLKNGEKILIHSGAGGIGLAAINICLHHKCEIFTTVGTQEKKDFLMKMFPQILPSHIGNSRDDSFELLIRRMTNGMGVDLVLNSLAEEKLKASVRCLATRGRFLELGKYDLAINTALGMKCFLNEIAFHGIDLSQVVDNKKILKEVGGMMQMYIQSNVIKPLPRTVFERDEVEKAFRYMITGKHIGKLLIKIRDEEPKLAAAKPKTLLLEAVPRFYCQPHKTYVICGGLGGLGMELGFWLVNRGARKLVLSSRRGVSDGVQTITLHLWKTRGVEVIISTDNIAEEDGVRRLLRTANSLGPVCAIFNLAAVLEDNVFINQTEQSFRNSSLPKFNVTLHLDKVSRELCPNLEHFVVFSSIASGLGNGGQSNYGMSNSSMERVCEMRRAHNLPALAIEFGPISDVGMAARLQESNPNFTFRDIKLQSRNSFKDVLDLLLHQSHPVVLSMVVEKTTDTGSGEKGLAETIGLLLGIRDIKSINLHLTLAQFGLDSMMGIEIKEVLLKNYGIDLSVQEVANLTLAKLLEMENKNFSTLAKVEKTSETSFVKNIIEAIDDKKIIPLWKEFPRGIRRIRSALTYGGTTEIPTDKYPTLFVLPIILGYFDFIADLSRNLNAQVLCLQFDCERVDTSIEEIAQTLVAEIKSRLSKDQKFYLVGISFGGLVALEMVRMLEAEGRSGRLWLIDSSPQSMQNIICSEFSITVEMLNDAKKMVGEKFLDSMIQEHFEKYMGPSIIQKYTKSFIDIFRRRLILILTFESKRTTLLKTPVTLIRTMEDQPIENNYNLHQFFENPVKVYLVKANHVTIIRNAETAKTIQKELELEYGQIRS